MPKKPSTTKSTTKRKAVAKTTRQPKKKGQPKAQVKNQTNSSKGVIKNKPNAANSESLGQARHPSIARKPSRARKPAENSLPSRKRRQHKITSSDSVIMAIDAGTTLAIKTRKDFWGKLPSRSQLVLEARRPDDLLLFSLHVQNLKVAEDRQPRLIKQNSELSSSIIIELPPQHFGEQTFLEATGPEVTAATETFKETSALAQDKNTHTTPGQAESPGELPASRMRMASNSRLAFTMPTGESELALNIEAILDACRNWPMRLGSLAIPAPKKNVVVAAADWLKDITTLQSWDDYLKLTDESISTLTSQQTSSAIKNSAKRLATQITADYRGSTNKTGQTAIGRLFDTESAALKERFKDLQKDDLSELGDASLSFHTVKYIAASDLELAVSIIDSINKLKLIFKPHQPPASVTALELPYRLTTSPLPGSHWCHASEVVLHNNRSELWHTRLSSRLDSGKPYPAPIRAIWSPDYELPDILDSVNASPPKPYRMSLDALDREMLVKLMAGFTETQFVGRGTKAYTPIPSTADRLMLSAMGGLIDAEGSWDPRPKGVGLEQWKHIASLGRDQYVRVVYRGFLYPFGHSASLIKVTERKFENYKDSVNQRIAVLRQRFFIVVREHTRTYNGSGHSHHGRNFPFGTIRITTRVTPNINDPNTTAAKPDSLFDGTGVPKRACFWPRTGSNDFQFELSGTDISGKKSSFSMSLLFVGEEAITAIPTQVREAYNAETDSRRSTDFSGAIICYAPLADNPADGGDPRLPTGNLVFAGENVNAAPLEAQIYPVVDKTNVGIQAVQKLLNDPDATLEVEYPTTYKKGGFKTAGTDKNPGELFLQATAAFSMGFGESSAKSDSLGAIASPSMDIAGLSRVLGPIGDPDNIKNATFDPQKFFKDAKILGGITIADLIDLVGNLTDAPKMLTRELPEKLEASFNWQTIITKSDSALFVPSAGGATDFVMQGIASSPITQPTAMTYESTATLKNFKINLFDLITIWFDKLEFIAKSGSKPDVVVDLHPLSATEGPVEFGGPLEFVNTLSEIIPMDGFSDPPNLEISPSGLTASYSLAIPSVQVGIFALTNMSIGAGFSLPFNNEPMQVRFNFSERQNPFSLTVSLFGGGGFFALGVGAEGVNEIEAALEFGAAIAIDLGVASGGIEVKAGVYFHWLHDTVELTGYVRLHGELSILGLISASLTFNLQLSYKKEGSESLVWGEATLVIEVDVLLFSASVEVHCYRKFAGSESDPTFLDLIPEQSVWAEYCGAFAQEEAA